MLVHFFIDDRHRKSKCQSVSQRSELLSYYIGWSKSSNRQYKIYGYLVNPGFHSVCSCSIVVGSWWLGDVASSGSGRFQWGHLAGCHRKFQWSQRWGEIGPPWQLISISLSDYQRGESHWVLCSGHGQDVALWWRQLPWGLLEKALNYRRVRCLTFQHHSSCSWARVCLQIGNNIILPKKLNCNVSLCEQQVSNRDYGETKWSKQDTFPSEDFVSIVKTSTLWTATNQMSQTFPRRTNIRPWNNIPKFCFSSDRNTCRSWCDKVIRSDIWFAPRVWGTQRK